MLREESIEARAMPAARASARQVRDGRPVSTRVAKTDDAETRTPPHEMSAEAGEKMSTLSAEPQDEEIRSKLASRLLKVQRELESDLTAKQVLTIVTPNEHEERAARLRQMLESRRAAMKATVSGGE